jgi:phosphate transport system substrate-binding protein
MKRITPFIFILTLLILSSCKTEQISEPTPETEEISVPINLTPEEYPAVDGSTATLPLAVSLRSAITGEDEEELKLTTIHSKTISSFSNLIYGSCDLLLVYPPSDEVRAFEGFEKLEMKAIGKDALVFFTNKDNPVENLSLKQIQDIYSGYVTNWNEVGGADSPINAYQRNADSGSQVMMENLVMKDIGMAAPEPSYSIGGMEGIVKTVASYKDSESSIGYSVYYYLKSFLDAGEEIKIISVDGIETSNKNIANGTYALSENFYAAINTDAPTDSPQRKIYDFLTSEDGKKFIESVGYVAIK